MVNTYNLTYNLKILNIKTYSFFAILRGGHGIALISQVYGKQSFVELHKTMSELRKEQLSQFNLLVEEIEKRLQLEKKGINGDSSKRKEKLRGSLKCKNRIAQEHEFDPKYNDRFEPVRQKVEERLGSCLGMLLMQRGRLLRSKQDTTEERNLNAVDISKECDRISPHLSDLELKEYYVYVGQKIFLELFNKN